MPNLVAESVVLCVTISMMFCAWCLPCILTRFPRNSAATSCRSCLERTLHLYIPFVSVLNVLLLLTVLDRLDHWDLNDVFFALILVLIKTLDTTQSFLTNLTTILTLYLLWRFRERIATAIGIDNLNSILRGVFSVSFV